MMKEDIKLQLKLHPSNCATSIPFFDSLFFKHRLGVFYFEIKLKVQKLFYIVF